MNTFPCYLPVPVHSSNHNHEKPKIQNMNAQKPDQKTDQGLYDRGTCLLTHQCGFISMHMHTRVAESHCNCRHWHLWTHCPMYTPMFVCRVRRCENCDAQMKIYFFFFFSLLHSLLLYYTILDDCFRGKQSKAAAYYTRGRHNNCDTLYISQNYFGLPRQSVRENSNFIILFPQNTKSLFA